MPQKFFEPFKKLPQQFQNLSLIQKIQGLTHGRSPGSFGSYLASTYGCLKKPSTLAFDSKLGLLAVGTTNGLIKIFGVPGVSFTVLTGSEAVMHLCFLPQEGRLVAAFADGHISISELNKKNWRWFECSRIRVIHTDKEQITSLALGYGVLYVGSSCGTVYQIAVKNGRMCLGDPALTACTSAMIAESVPADKRNELGVDSPVVALEVQPGGGHILIAYAGGCVAVAVPQTIPEAVNGVDVSVTDKSPVAPKVEQEVTTPSVEDSSEHASEEVPVSGDQVAEKSSSPIVDTTNVTEIPVKVHTERRGTSKLKELTRSLRRFDTSKLEDSEPPLPVAPAPKISHLLLRDQPVEWATWRVAYPEVQSTEVTIAYVDGAYQVWPISAISSSQDLTDPVVVSKREPPTTPYGPLPCGSIKKIIQHPGFSGAVLTAFSGGLPRAEFNDRHVVTVLQDPEHHVCFQFGSEVKDFIFIPDKYVPTEEQLDLSESPVTASCSPQCASALIVLTERELVAIDLRQPNWPAFSSPYLNCLDLSPITSVAYLNKVPMSLINRLHNNAKCEQGDISLSKWPIWGGESVTSDGHTVDSTHNNEGDVLALGHANGGVTLLNIDRGDCLYRLGTFYTDSLFNLTDSANGLYRTTVEVETWPPFRRVGDCALTLPFCADQPDPRLSVTQLVASVSTSTNSITIVVGGAAGQVSIWTVHEEIALTKIGFEPDIARIHVNLLEQDAYSSKYSWKGSPALQPFEGVTQLCGPVGAVLTPCAFIQLDPPAPITALAHQSDWNLLALGSAHGFALVDLLAMTTVYTDFYVAKLLDAKTVHAVNAVQSAIMNRGKQITATMRQSFRRLKHLRTPTATPTTIDQEKIPENAPTDDEPVVQPMEVEPAAEITASSSDPVALVPTESVTVVPDTTPGEPPEEENVSPTDTEPDVVSETVNLHPEEFGDSTVRSLLFVDTYVASPVSATAQSCAIPSSCTPSLWVGTAKGRAFAHSLNWECTAGPVVVRLHKEIQLQHHAPVIGLCVIDAATHAPITGSSRTRTSCVSVVKPIVEPDTTQDTAQSDEVTDSEPAQVTTTVTPQQTHQLLLCSEEQIKLFQLPSLRALHKYKFVDRLRLPGHHGGTTTVDSGASKHDKGTQDTDSTEAITDISPEQKCVNISPQPHRRCLTAFGVQAFERGSGEQRKIEWNVIVTRHDGQTVILSLPNLRKLFKGLSAADSGALQAPCISTLSYANFVFWPRQCQLLTEELAFVPRLTPLTAPLVTVNLPDWCRPQEPAAVEQQDKLCETVPALDTETVEVHSIETVEVVADETPDTTATLDEMAENRAAFASTHPGDVTIDSIKEYLNCEGTVTVKTIETSSEKRTLVDSGHVSITLHETEQVDGKVVKDDLLKFSTAEPATVTISEAI